MTELIISLVFAFMFIMAYLFVARLRNTKTLGASTLSELFQSNGKGSKAIAGQKPPLFLTTKELSEHHSGSGQSDTQRQR
jgi:dolichyl-phosphate-mannose--protein O-mannosyl transferase